MSLYRQSMSDGTVRVFSVFVDVVGTVLHLIASLDTLLADELRRWRTSDGSLIELSWSKRRSFTSRYTKVMTTMAIAEELAVHSVQFLALPRTDFALKARLRSISGQRLRCIEWHATRILTRILCQQLPTTPFK